MVGCCFRVEGCGEAMASPDDVTTAAFESQTTADLDLEGHLTDSPTRHLRDGDFPRVGSQDAPALEHGHGDSMSRPLKPPNVLVYCGTKDTDRAFEDARKFARATLNPNTYVIYNLKHEKVASDPWRDNTSLLFIATDRLADDVNQVFLDFFQHGGIVFSSSPHFNHLFCDHFLSLVTSRDEQQRSPVVPLCYHNKNTRLQAAAVVSGNTFGRCDVMQGSHDLSVDVLAKDNSDNALILLVAHPSGGFAILSQVIQHFKVRHVHDSNSIY